MKLHSHRQHHGEILDILKLVKLNSVSSKLGLFVLLFAVVATPVLTYSPNRNTVQGKSIKALAHVLGGSHGKFLREMVNHKSSVLDLVYNYISAQLNPFNHDSITIDIPLKSYNRLEAVRQEALEDKAIIRKDAWVKAILSSSNSRSPIPIKLRIKGDLIDHLQFGNWSFRIKTRKSSNYEGMKVFSIQPAITRSYLYESIFHALLKNEGLPFLRYDFKRLIINGRDYGVYAIEEGFAKEAIENSRYRDSVILRFAEDNFFSKSVEVNKLALDLGEDIDRISLATPEIDQFRSSIRSFDESRLTDTKSYSKAVNLLGSYLDGSKSAGEVFDLDAVAAFYAVTDLLKTWHARRWHNIRLYYEPISGRLVPFGFDASFSQDQNYIPAPLSGEFSLFNDLEFSRKYVLKSEEILSKQYLDAFFAGNSDLFRSQLRALHKSFPFLNSFEDRIRAASKLMQANIDPPKDPFIVKESSTPQRYNQITLLFSSHSSLPIKLSHLKYKGYEWAPLSSDIVPPRSAKSYNKYYSVTFKRKGQQNRKPISKSSDFLAVNYSSLGSSKLFVKTFDILPMAPKDVVALNTKNLGPIELAEPLINPYPRIFDLHSKTASLTLKTPKTFIKSTLRIPEGLTIRFNAGSTVTFAPGASLISRSPVEFIGTAKRPIKINGSNNSGILILNTRLSSTIRYVHFNGLSTISDPVHSVSGAVTFFQSPVQIGNSKFYSNNSEDSLNLFRSPFQITSTTFENSFSDGLDVDFSDGSISDSEFSDIGNDALDFSGSNVVLKNIRVIKARDKVLSAGENSTVNLTGLSAYNSGVGITSKDSSVVYAHDLTYLNLDVCMAAFNKKPVYNGGRIYVDKVSSGCDVKYLLEPYSSIHVDREELSANTSTVEDLMYGRKYGKATVK